MRKRLAQNLFIPHILKLLSKEKWKITLDILKMGQVPKKVVTLVMAIR